MFIFHRIFWAACCFLLVMDSAAPAGSPPCNEWQSGPMVGSTPNGANRIVRALANWDPDVFYKFKQVRGAGACARVWQASSRLTPTSLSYASLSYRCRVPRCRVRCRC